MAVPTLSRMNTLHVGAGDGSPPVTGTRCGVGTGVSVGRESVTVLLGGRVAVTVAVAAARVGLGTKVGVWLTAARVCVAVGKRGVADGWRVGVVCLGVALNVARIVSIGSIVRGRCVGSSVGRGGTVPCARTSRTTSENPARAGSAKSAIRRRVASSPRR